MKKKVQFISRDIHDTVNYLTGMLSLTTNAMRYFDTYYIEKKYISLRKLNEIRACELNINLLEFSILKIIHQRINKGTGKLRNEAPGYVAYAAQNFDLLHTYLFLSNTPPARTAALKKIRELNSYFIEDVSVRELVQERNALITHLGELDNFTNEEEILLRYKRIFLQRRLSVYSYCDAEANVYIDKFTIKSREASLLTDALKALLENQKDFAAFEFEAIFEQVAKIPGSLKIKKKLKNREDIDALKRQLAEKDKAFKLTYLNNTSVTSAEAQNYQQHLKERDALKYLIDEKVKAQDYGEQFVQHAKDQSFSNISVSFGKMVMADIGATVGDSLWKLINGKSDEVDWGHTAKKIGVAIAEAGILAISNAFFGGLVSSSMVKSIFSSYHPVPQSPELLALGEVKKVLANVEKKIDELTNQVSLFEAKITNMINGLPDQVAAKLKERKINAAVEEVLTIIRSARFYSDRIIRGGSCDENEFALLNTFDFEMRQKITSLLTKIFGEVNLMNPAGDGPYLISKQPKKETLLYDLIICAQEEGFYRDFYTTYHEVKEVIMKITDELFEAYNFTRPLVIHALGICYVTHYTGANEVKQESIVNNLQNWAKEDAAICAMLYVIKGDLEHYVLGENNTYLINKIETYKKNPYAFNFTKSFYLEAQKTPSEWQPIYFDYADEKPGFKFGNGWKDFYITPGSFQDKNADYSLYNVNPLLGIENFSRKMTLGFNDQIGFIGENKLFSNVRVIAPFNKDFSNRITYCFATDYNEELTPGNKKTVQLLVDGLQLEIYAVKAGAGNWEYRIDLVNSSKERKNFCSAEFRYADTRSIRLHFDGSIPSIELNVYDKITGMFMGSLGRIGFQVIVDKIDALNSFSYIQVGDYSSNYRVDNKFGFGYVPVQENQNKLVPGHKLGLGDYIFSHKERYKLLLQPDGNMVLYAKYAASTGNAYWSSDTQNKGFVAMLLGNNCLNIYDREGKLVYYSSILKNQAPDGYLEVQEDRNIVIYSKGRQPLWSSKSQKTDFNTVDRGEFLLPGEKLTSAEDNRVTFEFQKDENLVIYFTKNSKKKVLWANGFIKNADKFVVTGEGFVQVLDKNGAVLKSFSSRVDGPRCRVQMQTHFAIGVISNYYLKLYGPSTHQDLVAGTY